MELLSNNTGNWNTYREINPITNVAHIIRIPKMFTDFKIKQYIKKHNLVKSTGLPTLSIVEESMHENKKGIKTEDINYNQSKLYVSPNSVCSLCNEKQRILDILCSINSNSPIQNKKNPEYEEYRYKNKLKEITNFEEFLEYTKDELLTAAKKGVLIEYDSYFFGTEKDNDISSIDYKIVDLDNIYSDTGKTLKELHELNISEFKKAVNMFISYFVITEKQEHYSRLLNSLL